MTLSKNVSEKYDTLLLSSSYKELSYKHHKQYQQAYFNRFPSTWYDFERTFNGAFFKKEMEAIFTGREVTWSHLSGATDARHFKKMGAPIAILGLAGKGAHTANERLPLASMQETADFFVQFAKKTF